MGLTTVCHSHHTLFLHRTVPGGIPTFLARPQRLGRVNPRPGSWGSGGPTTWGCKVTRAGRGPRARRCLRLLSAAQQQGLRAGAAVESSPPAVQAVPQGPCGQGLRRHSLASLPSPLEGWRVAPAMARTSGGRAAGTSAHMWLPAHPGPPPGVAAGPHGQAGPPRTRLYGVLACGSDPAVSIRSTQPPSRGGN